MKSSKLPESQEKQNPIEYLVEQEKECRKLAEKCKSDVCFDVSVEKLNYLAMSEVYRDILFKILQ